MTIQKIDAERQGKVWALKVVAMSDEMKPRAFQFGCSVHDEIFWSDNLREMLETAAHNQYLILIQKEEDRDGQKESK